MDDLVHSILYVTHHSENPLQEPGIHRAIEDCDRLPVDHAGQSTVRDTINELHSDGLLCSLIFAPDGHELAVGFGLTGKGRQRLAELADRF